MRIIFLNLIHILSCKEYYINGLDIRQCLWKSSPIRYYFCCIIRYKHFDIFYPIFVYITIVQVIVVYIFWIRNIKMFVENFTLEFFMNVRIATCMLKPSTLIYMRVTPDCALNYRLIENIFYHWINQKCKKKSPFYE